MNPSNRIAFKNVALAAILCLLGACASIAPGNVETAIADVEAGIAKLEDAAKQANTLAASPAAKAIQADIADAYHDFDKARHDLLGTPAESCWSRCGHECTGADVASCRLQCPLGCAPHCCGCKGFDRDCDHCQADCNPGRRPPCDLLPDPSGIVGAALAKCSHGEGYIKCRKECGDTCTDGRAIERCIERCAHGDCLVRCE